MNGDYALILNVQLMMNYKNGALQNTEVKATLCDKGIIALQATTEGDVEKPLWHGSGSKWFWVGWLPVKLSAVGELLGRAEVKGSIMGEMLTVKGGVKATATEKHSVNQNRPTFHVSSDHTMSGPDLQKTKVDVTAEACLKPKLGIRLYDVAGMYVEGKAIGALTSTSGILTSDRQFILDAVLDSIVVDSKMRWRLWSDPKDIKQEYCAGGSA